MLRQVNNSAYDHTDPVIVEDDLLDAWKKLELEYKKKMEKIKGS
jgi:hypothetical protein